MSDLIVTERPHYCRIDIWRGETWYDPLPKFVDPISGVPFDLTSVTSELFLRPDFDHLTRLALLTSVGSAGIRYDDAVGGLASIFYPQASVDALPLSPADGWQQFWRFSFTDPALGAVTKLLWTGPLFIHPARVAATP